MITSGSLPLGVQIDERSLAEKMSVSRTPLREAISTLVKEGIVEYRAYRGHFVRTFTAKQVNDLYEVRKSLEGLAARLAVARLNEQRLRELSLILEEVRVSLEANDLEGFAMADRKFHESLAKFSNNETLIELLNRLSLQIQLIRTIANRDPDVIKRTSEERPKILAALRAKDAELAARLMEEHIEGVRRAVIHQFQTLEDTTVTTESKDTAVAAIQQ